MHFDATIISEVIGLLVVLGGGLATVGHLRKKRKDQELPVEETRVADSTASVSAPADSTDSVSAPLESAEMPADTVSPEIITAVTETLDDQENVVETPAPVKGRMVRLRERLARSGGFGRALLNVFSRGDLTVEDWEEIEDTLLMADLGVEATEELLAELRTQAKILGTNDAQKMREILREKLLELVGKDWDRSLQLTQIADEATGLPGVMLAVGVNGTGKTTTVGKLARILVAENKRVLLGAADTFRAAAADQLQTWGDRVGVPVVRLDKEGGDPAAVAFEAVKTGAEQQVDTVLIDTAGRLQNKKDLMDELGKVKRVAEKTAPVTEVLLVLDATTGQNGMQQAKVFSQVVQITGIVLTKLDGTAKGGIVVSVQRELGVPVKLVGLGEGPDDLAPFDPEIFVEALLK